MSREFTCVFFLIFQKNRDVRIYFVCLLWSLATMGLDLQSLFRERGSLSTHVNSEGTMCFCNGGCFNISWSCLQRLCCLVYVIIFVLSSIIVGNVNERTLPLWYSLLTFFLTCIFCSSKLFSMNSRCSAKAPLANATMRSAKRRRHRERKLPALRADRFEKKSNCRATQYLATIVATTTVVLIWQWPRTLVFYQVGLTSAGNSIRSFII